LPNKRKKPQKCPQHRDDTAGDDFCLLFLEGLSKMGGRTNIKGLTLIELLVVLVIIVALAAIAVPRISQSASGTKIRACRTNINLLNSAIEQCYVDNASYPENLFSVSQSTVYFPDGGPICPVTNSAYPKALTANFRVDESGHLHVAAVAEAGK